MTTAADIVNGALELIAAQTMITSLTDGSPAANAAAVIYQPTVSLLLRQTQPDFSRVINVPLAPVAFAGDGGWSFAYQYPANCLRFRQVIPLSWDTFDPQPIRWSVNIVGATKAILTNQRSANGVYTTGSVTENDWDAEFTEAVKRQLANPLSMALSGRPDFAKELLEEAMRYEQMVEVYDESATRMG